MSVLSRQSIAEVRIIEPFFERGVAYGMSYGLGPCGYDIRIRERRVLDPGVFTLASSIEHFVMPANVLGMVKDKSSWARQGVSAFNTIIEPGWSGYLTLELVNHGFRSVNIQKGAPIAQIIFMWLDKPTDMPYKGKYNDQGPVPTEAIHEPENDHGKVRVLSRRVASRRPKVSV